MFRLLFLIGGTLLEEEGCCSVWFGGRFRRFRFVCLICVVKEEEMKVKAARPRAFSSVLLWKAR